MPSPFDHLSAAHRAPPRELVDALLSPALVVDLDVVRRNVARVIARCGSPDRWRPHVKTTKMPAVWAELVRAGIRHFKCATTREALHLLDSLDREGVPDGDVLVAYPLVGPSLARLEQIAARHPGATISVLCEAPGDVDATPPSLSIVVDLNPGMNRTGVPRDRWDEVASITRRAGDRFRGLHYYDGHLHDDGVRRRERIHQGYGDLVALVDELVRDGVDVAEIVTAVHPRVPRGARLRAVRGRFGSTTSRVAGDGRLSRRPLGRGETPDFELEPAALVFTRVP